MKSLINDPSKPCVFIGPSGSDKFYRLVEGCNILPPIQRGQLYDARKLGCNNFLIIDGIFASELAVSPREVVDVLRDGAVICGASSMGALRAAECWPAGMIGYGLIFRLYRYGFLSTDDEVAVIMDPRDYHAMSVALINIRYAVKKACNKGVLDAKSAQEIILTAEKLKFFDRSWGGIFKTTNLDLVINTRDFISKIDLKKDDAVYAADKFFKYLSSLPEGEKVELCKNSNNKLSASIRYTGHDPFLGYSSDYLDKLLLKWIISTGRYQKYIWSIASQDDYYYIDRSSLPEDVDLPEYARERLALFIAKICTSLDEYAACFAEELKFIEEYDSEVMRMYSIHSLSDNYLPKKVNKVTLSRIREEIAIAHGLRDWDMLLEEVAEGLLFDAIPFKWIDGAVNKIALVKSNNS